MADFLDRSDFDAIETRPLRTLPVIGADGGDARIYELQLPNGRVRISLSAPTPRILEDVANSTFGAELVELPNTLMSSVTGQVVATSLRAAAEAIVTEAQADWQQVVSARPKPSAAGIVNRVGGAVEDLIVRASQPLITRVLDEQRQLAPGTVWVGPGSVIDLVRQLAFVGGLPAVTGEAWPPRSPIGGDDDLAVDIGISAFPAPGGDPNAAWELRFILDPEVFTTNHKLYDRFWMNLQLLNVVFVARKGAGIQVFHTGDLAGRAGKVGGIGEEVAVSNTYWAHVTSVGGSTTYEKWGTAKCQVDNIRFL